jgi:hypothetical protein
MPTTLTISEIEREVSIFSSKQIIEGYVIHWCLSFESFKKLSVSAKREIHAILFPNEK